MQEIVKIVDGQLQKLFIPAETEQVMPNVLWGDCAVLFTPAYWKAVWWLENNDGLNDGGKHHRLGQTLTEETAACLLGGYGIPAEVGLAAFDKLRRRDIFEGTKSYSCEEIYKILSEPLIMGERKVRYRFAKQKSKYLSSALQNLKNSDPPDKHKEFRDWLLDFEGIGYKTASWITRNWLSSDEVAIIDIHVHRAGLISEFYQKRDSPAKNYLMMESKFLDFANAVQIKASQLDSLIWREMKFAGSIALRILNRL